MREVIIGLIQLENELGDKKHNLEKAPGSQYGELATIIPSLSKYM
mgnify:CR=1 FL=1